MAKDPAFLFYPNDYIGGTMGMTFEEKGAYIELLMLQFNRGHMTSHMIGRTVGQIWDNIKDKFVEDENGLFYNERLELEQNKRKSYSESRRNNKKGINQYTKKEEKKVGHMTSHMENEDVNENRVIDRKEIVSYLNSVLGTKYKYTSASTSNPITARLNEGYTVSDFKQVIDIKSKEWQSDEKFSKFLRPQTLFGTKFESYLNQKTATLSRDEQFEIAKLKHLRDVQSELDNINAAKPNRLRRLP